MLTDAVQAFEAIMAKRGVVETLGEQPLYVRVLANGLYVPNITSSGGINVP